MIVVGIDPHKHNHTAVAVSSPIGELTGELSFRARREGFEQLLRWARERDGERLFALEDVRRCSGALERFLIARGERVVRVSPRLMGVSRKGQRQRGKSDAIDALAVARVALREPELPKATLAGPERELALLADHREDLVQERNRVVNRLRWHLHDLDPSFEVIRRGFSRTVHLDRSARFLARQPQTTQVVIAREQLRRLRQLKRDIDALERQLEELVEAEAPQLLTLHGCGPLNAARILAEVAGIERFATPAKLAMHAGVAPIEASSGQHQRHRLNRYGNRRLNAALHQVALSQARWNPEAKTYLDRKKAEGKSPKEALRCLKRQLATRVFRLLTQRATHPQIAKTA